jgi:primosomal protein N' (replication factor Y)
MEKRYADIVLRLAVPRTFQFSVPEDLRSRIRPGQRVRVPLRRGSDIGYVAALSDTPKVKGIRPILTILDVEPLLPPDLLDLLLWVADHTLSPPGMVFRAGLPRAIHFEKTERATAREKSISTYRLGIDPADLPGTLEKLEKRAPVQARLLRQLARGPLRAQEFTSPSPSALRSLTEKGLVDVEEVAVQRGLVAADFRKDLDLALTPAQEKVFQEILPSLGKRKFAPFLLHGVTGSGKSEIYIRAVQSLPSDRQAIILVPEVSLTVQLIRHFQERFPFPLALWHHQLSEGEKFDLWRQLRRGEIRVVIGARSAVFAPLPQVGLIVVDEEQESSYKQGDAPSYHARDLALHRGRLQGATILLGSATPSMESYYRAEQGEYTLLSLPQRYREQPLPKVEMLDLKDFDGSSTRGRGDAGKVIPKGSPVTLPLYEAAADALERGSQVLFFLNRRGFAPFTICRGCGWTFKCPNCQVALVFHRQDNALLCHYCGHKAAPPGTCPSCRGTDLRLSGTGTQRLEEEVRSLFPERSVARLDRDATSRKGAGGRLVDDFAAGRTDILVGTQMVAKGLHFPRLALVGVLAPDLGLNLPDFRAAERTFQVVTQVAGRAGREDIPGRVIIQTFQPEHYALQAAAEHDFLAFYRREIEFRRELDYPPFCDLILLRLDGPNPTRLEETADGFAGRIEELLRCRSGEGFCRILGPVPAPLHKIRNRYRYHLLVKARPLERAAGPLREHLEELGRFVRQSNCRLNIDVNPMSLL